MSSPNPEESINPEPHLTPAEIDDLDRLEAIAQQRLGSYVLVGAALAEVRNRQLYRDSHPSFEAYLRERWGLNGDPFSQATISADAGAAPPADQASTNTPAEALASAWALRWLLTQASGTIGEVAHLLESRAADMDDGARAQLRDDVLVVDGDLAVVKALLLDRVDWDAELSRLLDDELPPLDTDADPEDDDD